MKKKQWNTNDRALNTGVSSRCSEWQLLLHYSGVKSEAMNDEIVTASRNRRSSVTHICRSGWPSHDVDDKTVLVMTLTLPVETLSFSSFLVHHDIKAQLLVILSWKMFKLWWSTNPSLSPKLTYHPNSPKTPTQQKQFIDRFKNLCRFASKDPTLSPK